MSIKTLSLLGVANAVVIIGTNKLAAKKMINFDTSFSLKAMTITLSVMGILASLYEEMERSENEQKEDAGIIADVAPLSLVTILVAVAFSEYNKMLEALNRR